MNKRVIVVGAGIAGIAASIRLRNMGFRVDVFEANPYPGGKLSMLQLGPYRFDAGPSLFTLPEQVDELFRLSGKNPKDHFEYIKLTTVCHYFWEDGTHVQAHANTEAFANEVYAKLGEPVENIHHALKNSAYIYKHLSPLFMHRSLHRWDTWLNPKALTSYLRLGKLGIFNTMHSANELRFQNPKTVQLFDRYATYNGSDPYQTPATLNIIPHLEFNMGAFFPKKGMYDITQSLCDLAENIGIDFHFGHKAEKILIDNGVARGVHMNGLSHYADIVVNNMDMVNAYKHLLKDQKQPTTLLKQPKSSSALIFYWGIKKVFPQLGLHNILFSDDYRKEFDYIFNKKTIYQDPTIYINITSVHKPDDAPKDGMNWFTMINTPNNEGQDWGRLINEARRSIIQKVNRILSTNIESFIEREEILDPRGIEQKTSSAQGALYGNSSNNRYAAFLRHANYSSNIKNLYFCGGSVHPGGGIPLCLLSAKIMSEIIAAKK